MNMRIRNAGRILIGCLLFPGSFSIVSATTVTYDFDTFDDGVRLTKQYSGLSFTNATVLKGGLSLNEVSFPPHSGDSVVVNDGGSITINLGTPAHRVSGYFTYMDGLTLSAYDSGHNLLALANSVYQTNLADGTGSPGSIANELLSVSSADDQIASIVISSSTGGESFVLDDLTALTSAIELPEPGTLSLFLSGLAFALPRQARPRLGSKKLGY
jgi:hypothetical protein